MAENKTSAPKPSSLSDTHSRDTFIAVALKEIIKDQIAQKKWNFQQAAVLAVRCANEVMVARGDTEPLKVVVSKGVIGGIVGAIDFAFPNTDKTVAGPSEDGKPKTIAEIIGDAEPVAEVK